MWRGKNTPGTNYPPPALCCRRCEGCGPSRDEKIHVTIKETAHVHAGKHGDQRDPAQSGLCLRREKKSGRRWGGGAAGNTGLLGRKWVFYPVSLGTVLQLGEGGTLFHYSSRFLCKEKKETQGDGSETSRGVETTDLVVSLYVYLLLAFS